MMAQLCYRRLAFTLMEVLVVIAIIGMLVALLFPAFQVLRESSRRAACANNLYQLAVAVKLHEEMHQIYPTGGWGADWVGDPDGGYRTRQPGGWGYNVLPYIEQKALREIGRGMSSAYKRIALTELLKTPIPSLNCPSRRPSIAYPYRGPSALQNADPPTNVGKSDYAISDQISSLKSEVTVAAIQRKRGLSKMLLIGEKSVSQSHYDDGLGAGDMLSMYAGDSDDIRRSAWGTPSGDVEGGTEFGSAHSGGCNIVMCDGAVQFVLNGDKVQP
jgi:prepilin-type N-terminal cleavage/methylation domain-containing protein/prepilin-type processing-associated H-X9-DG protein